MHVIVKEDACLFDFLPFFNSPLRELSGDKKITALSLSEAGDGLDRKD